MIPKVIALYLPQFHCIPENDQFWGKNFTDWISVKKAKPLFEGHNQPRVPFNNNYYDLSVKENVLWQAKLAHEHGIYGFGVYHYWFNNEKNLLTKPAEIMRDSENLGVKYFFDWDNCLWKRSWSNVPGNDWAPMADNSETQDKNVKILIPYILGSESDWENHYNYVRQHFLSDNYEKMKNKPVFAITSFSKDILDMCDYWDELAKKDGFDGMCFIFKSHAFHGMPQKVLRYNYQPHHAGWDNPPFAKRVVNKIFRLLGFDSRPSITCYDYDTIWKNILSYANKHPDSNLIHGGYVDYDDSPRRGRMKAIIFKGATPEKFCKYFNELIKISYNQQKSYIFLTAWNEWGEGAYLEPDTCNGLDYLNALKNALKL